MKAQRLFEERKEPAYVRTREKEGGGKVGTNKIQCFCKKKIISKPIIKIPMIKI